MKTNSNINLSQYLYGRIKQLGITWQSFPSFFKNFGWVELNATTLKISIYGYIYLAKDRDSVDQCLRGFLHHNYEHATRISLKKQFLSLLFICGVKYETPKNKTLFWSTPDGGIKLSEGKGQLILKCFPQGVVTSDDGFYELEKELFASLFYWLNVNFDIGHEEAAKSSFEFRCGLLIQTGADIYHDIVNR